MKKIFALFAALFLAMAAFAGPAVANGGSDGTTPYTVNGSGVTLPAGDTFKANGHVNIKYTAPGQQGEKSKGIHFDPNNNQPGGVWIGKSNIPWSGFGLSGNFCVTWVQVDGYNQHFGEGGQEPFCNNSKPKKIDICHATSSKKNPYTRIEVSTESVTKMGHDSHSKDIIPPFSYMSNDSNGDVVEKTYPGKNWPAGEATLNNACDAPDERQKVTKPTYTYEDVCGVKNDVDLSVPTGTGYTVGPLVKDGMKQSITVTLNSDDYVWADDTDDPITFTATFTAESCDLPETGGEAQYNTALAGAALAGVVILGGVMLLTRRKSS